MNERFARLLAASVAALSFASFAVVACSSSSTGNVFDLDGSAVGDESSTSSPCGPNGVYGTYQINGTLEGTESLCGLNLGSFDGGTLTITQSPDAGATVTVTGSGAGYIDVTSCAASVEECNVTTSSCSGSKVSTETVSLSLSVTATALSGTSQLAYGGCGAPGLTFNGTR